MNYKELHKVLDCNIADATLSRLHELLNSKTCAIITAYRHFGSDGKKLSKEDNIKRNRDLRAIFNSNKMGVYQLVGHWQEAPDGMDYEEAKEQNLLTDVVERSYVVPCPSTMSDEDFKKFITGCMTIDGLTQGSFVYHNLEGFYLIFNDGSEEFLGKNVSMNKIGQAYSESVLALDTPFVFDCVRFPNGNSDRMAMKHQGLLWFTI